MKGIKKSIGTGISMLLLLCFTVTVLPMDFFHSHAQETTVCRDSQSNEPCTHTVHISSTKSSCWVCAVRVDTQYTSINVVDKIASFPAITLFSENEVTAFFFECLFAALRGPPEK